MMEWTRGEIIGKGSFSTINLATPRKNSSENVSIMAVKSSALAHSSMLQREEDILSELSDSPRILRCIGHDTTFENGEEVYNVFLELASRGNLAELVKSFGGKMNETLVRHYTKSVLQGLCYVHEKDYVHCDIKLQNILVCSYEDIKIGDFGLAKKVGEKKGSGLFGTPLYMSPEAILRNEIETPSDIWALGCVVVEMITGKPAWRCGVDADVSGLLFRIGFSDELPEIPQDISSEGKDFIKRCLVRDPTKRWTAEMLLNHPFVTDVTVSSTEVQKLCQTPSPKSAFDIPDWTPKSSSYSCFEKEMEESDCSSSEFASPAERIQQLATVKQPNCC
ncbi:Mitogen-activated protein kinase kinase kinase [Thalictrum thalictroides]|uniref:Mitogen-activated protein kinase kinase kinase n=1 Tax=Thalictrum thalictroides TaxID=46969 RepID=A0A7J6WS22_THATH|nr:Mitogen-activated protein kinase kinase kinase [Thalictrum thalictroides]